MQALTTTGMARSSTNSSSKLSNVTGELAVRIDTSVREATLITPREIDAVRDRQPGLALLDRVAHERRGGRRMRLGRDMRGHDDPRVLPERVIRRQRLVVEHVEYRTR